MNICRLVLVLLTILQACLPVAAQIDQPGKINYSYGYGVLSAMDRSEDPCNDFYEYACGSWLRKQHIPPDSGRYYRSIHAAIGEVYRKLKELLEEDHPNANAVRIYRDCLNDFASGPVNLHRIMPFREVLDELKDSKSFSVALAALHATSSPVMFKISVGVDEKHPKRRALYVSQDGLGLSYRDMYASKKDADVKLRDAYIRLIEDHLPAAGSAGLISRRGYAELAKQVFLFEKNLAFVSRPPEALQNTEENYNPVRISKLPEALSFKEYLEAANISVADLNDFIVVRNIKYLAKVAAMMARVKTDASWRNAAKGYLAFHLLRHMGREGVMGADVYMKNFEFEKLVHGVEQPPEKWKKCLEKTMKVEGDALAAAYVRKHFCEKTKKAAADLAVQIQKAFGESLDTLDWMSEATRAAAKKKLYAMKWEIGYPDNFDIHQGPQISNTSVGSVVRAPIQYAFSGIINPLLAPANMTDVGAWYYPERNALVILAGILQKPFFSDEFPDAMNYGSIGVIMGHEMGHGFGNRGRQYDASGRLRKWWSAKSEEEHKPRMKCIIDLYDSYKPEQTSMHVNGELTLNENLADIIGVKVAFRAFKKSGGNSSGEAARPPNLAEATELTNDQLFFVAYAQTCCAQHRTETLEKFLKSNPHAPAKFRVLGPLSQNADFARTFNCEVGTRYNPTTQCSVW